MSAAVPIHEPDPWSLRGSVIDLVPAYPNVVTLGYLEDRLTGDDAADIASCLAGLRADGGVGVVFDPLPAGCPQFYYRVRRGPSERPS